MEYTGEQIIKPLEAQGFHAEEWHTGGGCMTVFITRPEFMATLEQGEDIRDCAEVLAIGPGWANGYDPADELCVGAADAEEAEAVVTFDADATLEDIISTTASMFTGVA